MEGREQNVFLSTPSPQDLPSAAYPHREAGENGEGDRGTVSTHVDAMTAPPTMIPTTPNTPFENAQQSGVLHSKGITNDRAGEGTGGTTSPPVIMKSSVSEAPPLQSSNHPTAGDSHTSNLTHQTSFEPSSEEPFPANDNNSDNYLPSQEKYEEKDDNNANIVKKSSSPLSPSSRDKSNNDRQNGLGNPPLQPPGGNLAAMFRDRTFMNAPSPDGGLPLTQKDGPSRPQENDGHVSPSFVMDIPEVGPLYQNEKKSEYSPSVAVDASKKRESSSRNLSPGSSKRPPPLTTRSFMQWKSGGGVGAYKAIRQGRQQQQGGGGGAREGKEKTDSIFTDNSGGSGERRARSVQRVRGGLAYAQETAGAVGKKAMQQSALKAMKAFKAVQSEIDTGERLHSMFGIQKYMEETKIQELLAVEGLGTEKDQLKFDLKILKYYTNTEKDIELRDRRARAFIYTPIAQIFMAAVIILNVVFLGVSTLEVSLRTYVWDNETQAMTLKRDPVLFGTLTVSNILFAIIFFLEMVLRVKCDRLAYFRDIVSVTDFFNAWFGIVDVFVVVIGFFKRIDDPAFQSVLALLRLARLLRVLRFIRILKSFLPMRVLVDGMEASFFSLLYAATFFVVLVYGFAVFFTTAFGTNSELKEFWGDLFSSMYSLFLILTMTNWDSIADKTSQYFHWAKLGIILYTIFSYFVLFNVVTAVIVEAFSSTANRLENEASHFAMFTDYQVDEELFTSAMATAHLIRAHKNESWAEEKDADKGGRRSFSSLKSPKNRPFGSKGKKQRAPLEKETSADNGRGGGGGENTGSEPRPRGITRIGADGLLPTSDTYSGSGAPLEEGDEAKESDGGTVSDAHWKEGTGAELRRFFGILPRKPQAQARKAPEAKNRVRAEPQSSDADSLHNYVRHSAGRSSSTSRASGKSAGTQARHPLRFLRSALSRRRRRRPRTTVVPLGDGVRTEENAVLLQQPVNSNDFHGSGNMPRCTPEESSAARGASEQETTERQELGDTSLLKRDPPILRPDPLHCRPGPQSLLGDGCNAEIRDEEMPPSEADQWDTIVAEFPDVAPFKPRSGSTSSERPGVHAGRGNRFDVGGWGSGYDDISWRVNSSRRRSDRGGSVSAPTRRTESKAVTVPNNLDQAFTEVMPDSPYIELTRYHPLQILGARHVQLAMRKCGISYIEAYDCLSILQQKGFDKITVAGFLTCCRRVTGPPTARQLFLLELDLERALRHLDNRITTMHAILEQLSRRLGVQAVTTTRLFTTFRSGLFD